MLTAGHRQNHRSSPAYCLRQCKICGSITGMQSNHHIYLIHPFIRGNISLVKTKLFIPILFCQTAAGLNHIFFQIQSDNPHIILLQFMQIIIHGKGKIGLSTAKIQYGNLPVSGKLRQNIFHKFKESVNLSELIISGMYNPAFPGHNPQINQKIHWSPFFQDISFLTVMRKFFLSSRLILTTALLHPLKILFFFDGELAFFTNKNIHISFFTFQLHLPETL